MLPKTGRGRQTVNPHMIKMLAGEGKGDKVVETVHGTERKTEYYYGYKDQVSLNAETGLVTTSAIPGRADDYDGYKFQKLIEKEEEY